MARSGRGTFTRSSYRPIPRVALYFQVIAHTLALAGVNVKEASKSSSGSITSSGTYAANASIVKLLASAIAMNSTLVKSMSRSFSGSLTPAAALDDILVLTVVLVGAVSAISGDIAYIPSKYFTGQLDSSATKQFAVSAYLTSSLAAAGTVQKLSAKIFDGYLVPQSSFAEILSAFRILSGSVLPTQVLSKVARKPLSGNISASGTTRRTLAKVFAGALSMAASLVKQRVGDINAVSAVISIETIVNITMTYEDKSIVLAIDGI